MSLRVYYEVLNQKGSPALYTDTLANRPAFGFQGRLFVSTDSGQIFEDTGSAWTLVADAGVGGGTLSSVCLNGNSTATGIVITAGGLSSNSITNTGTTAGSILFAGTGGLQSQDNANFFWDDTNNRLGIGTASPGVSLDIHGTGTMVHLNGTSTNNSYLLFQNAGTGKWRIGNFYNAGDNTFEIYDVLNATNRLTILNTGATTLNGTFTATSLIKSGGTASQFLKADGSVDSTAYGTGSVTSIGLSSATSGVTIGSSPVTTSGTITLAIATASGSQNGLLSSTDWTTFNNKQNSLTNPITGTGTRTLNYLPLFSSTTNSIANSSVYEVFSPEENIGVYVANVLNVQNKLIVTGDVNAVNGLFSGKVGVGASTNPVYNLEVSSTGGSQRIRVGTLQNNDNTPKFEAITSNGTTIGNSAWLKVNDGGGFTLGSSQYTKTGGDSGNFANLSGEVETNSIFVSTSNNVLIGTTTDSGEKLQVTGNAYISAPGISKSLRIRQNYYQLYNEKSFNSTTNFLSVFIPNNGSAIVTITSSSFRPGVNTFSQTITYYINIQGGIVLINSANSFGTIIIGTSSTGNTVFFNFQYAGAATNFQNAFVTVQAISQNGYEEGLTVTIL